MAVITEYLKQYFACEDLAENSIDIRKRAVDYFVALFGDVDPNEVTASEAEKYKALIGKGKRKKLRASSKNSYIANIKPFFAWLQRFGYIEKNPFIGITLFREEKKIHKVYKPEEIRRIFEVMSKQKNGLCLQAAFALALCGMRRGEVFNTTAKDFIILENGRAEIKISHKEDGEFNWRWGTKGRKERYVPVPLWTQEIILERINWMQKPNPYLAVPKEHYDRALRRLHNNTFDRDIRNCAYRNFNRDFSNVLKRAGIEKKTLHDTRFTLCMNLFNADFPVAKVQKIIGHASITTTMKHYMELDQRQLCLDAAEKLENYMSKNVP